MRTTLSTILFFIATALCAQPQAEFSSEEAHLGEVAWQTPRVATFAVRNVGNEPLLITKMRPDCDCTNAVWPAQPILPGERAEISVRFDATLLGRFDKAIAVYTNAQAEPTYLHVIGKVVREVSFRPEDFAHRIADYHLDKNVIEFDNVKQGSTPKVIIQVFNGSTHAFHPELMHLPAYLSVVATPELIEPGKKGELHIELNSNLLRDMGLTKTSVFLSRFVGDRVSQDNELEVFITMVPELQASPEELAQAPKAELSDSTLTLGAFGKKKKLSGTIMLHNNGQSPLEVKRLQVYNPGLRVSLSSSVIKPGKSAKMKITLSADASSKGKRSILLITNDPRNPKIVVNIKN